MSELRRVEGRDAVKIAYYLMAIDGTVSRCEKTLFKKVAEGFGVNDANAWEDAIEKTDEILESSSDSNIIYKKIEEAVDKLIKGPDEYVDSWSSVPSNLLVWNLMTLAIKDLDYADNERKLIEHIAERLTVDKTVLVEMDNAIRALYAIQNEIKWLEDVEVKDDTSFLNDELRNRIKIIEESVKIFIEDEM